MTILLLALSLSADPAAKLPSARITLDGTQRTLAEASASLARQANIAIDTDRAIKDQPLQLRFDNVPFWEAIERLAKASNHRLVVGGQGTHMALVGGSGNGYRPVPHFIDGPIRISARQALSRLKLDTGASITEIQLDVAWEPRFKAFHAEVPGKTWAARDRAGRPLPITDDGSGKMEVTGAGLELTARLTGVPRTVPALARLDGTLILVGTAQLLQFTFEPGAPGEELAQKQAEVSAALKSFKKAGPFWTAAVEFVYPPGGPEFESFQSYLRDNEVWLRRTDGAKFPATGFELGTERNGRTTVLYRFKENDKDGPVVAVPKEWKLVVRCPGRVTEVSVPFTLQDIPLP